MALAITTITTSNLLAVILSLLSLCSLCSSTPVLPPANLTTTDPSTAAADLATTPPPLSPADVAEPLTPHDSLDQLIRGVRVLRRHGFNQMLLGGLYDSSNASLERGFYVFSVLMQSLNTIQLLGGAAASDDLAIFKVILNGVLNDTCQWFKSYDHTLDCTDRTHFLTTVLAMGLRPHLNNLECFLTGMDRFTGDQSLDPWVSRTFVAEPALGCQVCSTQNLQSCSNCS